MPEVCESPNLAVGGIHRDAGETVAEPVPAEFWESMIERCGDRDRQRKCDGLNEWLLYPSTESPGRGLAGNSGLVEGGEEEGGGLVVGIGLVV